MKAFKQKIHILLSLIIFNIQAEPITKLPKLKQIELTEKTYSQKNNYNSLLAISLMVKDEEKVIVDTIKPYVKAGINSFLIYDTGSTDNTVKVIEKYFKDNKVKNYHIEQGKFVDYSTSRNKALEFTEKYFPEAAFILMPDAEWYAEGVSDLLEFCHNHRHDDPKKIFCYNIKIKSAESEFYTSRLIRNHSKARFYGRVHETIREPYNGEISEPVCFKYNPKEDGIEKTVKRLAKDRDWLLEDHKDDPDNHRTIYYLAQTYFCLGSHEDAIKFYKLYTNFDNCTEYAYQALYAIGKIYDLEFETDKNHDKWLEKGFTNLIKAYTTRPHRAEPLVRIAQHYLLTQNWPLSFMFARQAVEIPYPKDDLLFVEKEYYDYHRFNILGISSWFVGQYDLGEAATRQALLKDPSKEHLHENMKKYLDQKEKTNRRS